MTEAVKEILEVFGRDDIREYPLFGDLVTEEFPRILYQTCGGKSEKPAENIKERKEEKKGCQGQQKEEQKTLGTIKWTGDEANSSLRGYPEQTSDR